MMDDGRLVVFAEAASAAPFPQHTDPSRFCSAAHSGGLSDSPPLQPLGLPPAGVVGEAMMTAPPLMNIQQLLVQLPGFRFKHFPHMQIAVLGT